MAASYFCPDLVELLLITRRVWIHLNCLLVVFQLQLSDDCTHIFITINLIQSLKRQDSPMPTSVKIWGALFWWIDVSDRDDKHIFLTPYLIYFCRATALGFDWELQFVDVYPGWSPGINNHSYFYRKIITIVQNILQEVGICYTHTTTSVCCAHVVGVSLAWEEWLWAILSYFGANLFCIWE